MRPLPPMIEKTRKSYLYYSLVSPCPTRSGSPAYAIFTLAVPGLPSPSALVFLREQLKAFWGGERCFTAQHCLLTTVGAPGC